MSNRLYNFMIPVFLLPSIFEITDITVEGDMLLVYFVKILILGYMPGTICLQSIYNNIRNNHFII